MDTGTRTSLLLTIGAGSLELREGFSEAVKAVLPMALSRLEEAVLQLLAENAEQPAPHRM